MNPIEWIKTKCVFPPVLSNKLVAGQPVGQHMLKFQEQILTDVLLKNKNVFVGWSRQISKSSLFSWIILYLLQNQPCGGIVAGPVYSQAGVIFRQMTAQIECSFQGEYKVLKDSIEHKKTGSFCKKVYNSPASSIGMQSLQFMVFDELGLYDRIAQQNYLTIQAGLAMSHEPIQMIASNPPLSESHWSNDYLKTLKANPAWAFHEFDCPKEDDPFAKESWAKSNPFVREYLRSGDKTFKSTYGYYASQAKQAKESRSLEIDFRRQQLGQRIAVESTKFCEISRIGHASEDVFKDPSIRWALGIDLSWTSAFSSFSLTGFAEDTESLFLYPMLHLANMDLRRPGQKLQFQEWASQGLITIHDKEVMPADIVKQSVQDTIKKTGVNIERVIADPALARAWSLDDSFADIEYIKTGPRQLSGAVRFLEKVIHDRKFFIVGPKNPCVLWMFENILVSERSKDFCQMTNASRWQNIDAGISTVLATKYLSENRTKTWTPFFVPGGGIHG